MTRQLDPASHLQTPHSDVNYQGWGSQGKNSVSSAKFGISAIDIAHLSERFRNENMVNTAVT